MKSAAGFIFHLLFKDVLHTAQVWHYVQLDIKERLDFHFVENSFLVVLTRPDQRHTQFEIFIGEDLEWHTPSSFIVQREMDEIGLLIDRHSA